MPLSRVNEIDLLRFIAALMVVFFHLAFRGHAADNLCLAGYPPLAGVARYGYLGVELFFMISGFVILMTAAEGNLRRFVVSRVVRLYPAFWACCTLTFLATLVLGGERFSASWGQFLVNLTMLGEFVGVQAIDDVYWSLFVEIRFYGLVAIVLLLGQIRSMQWLCATWLGATLVLEVAPVSLLREWLVAEYSAFFIAGALFYMVWEKGLTIGRVVLLVLSWGWAVHKSLQQAARLAHHYQTTMDTLMVVVLVSLFFLVMLLIALRKTGAFGAQRWPLLGALTYPLYLLHQNLGYMVVNRWHGSVNPHLLFWGVVAGALGCAYLVHTLVERRLGAAMKRGLQAWIKPAQALKRPAGP